jgi:hypothetical protein
MFQLVNWGDTGSDLWYASISIKVKYTLRCMPKPKDTVAIEQSVDHTGG